MGGCARYGSQTGEWTIGSTVRRDHGQADKQVGECDISGQTGRRRGCMAYVPPGIGTGVGTGQQLYRGGSSCWQDGGQVEDRREGEQACRRADGWVGRLAGGWSRGVL